MSTATDQTTGTLVERLGLKTIVESCLVLEDGIAALKDIEIGMMMGAGILPGPFSRADEQGLDEVLAALERAEHEWGENFAPPLLLRRLVNQGRLGKKSGQGFFPYPQPDPGQDRETIALETRGDIGICWLNRPPANPLSPQVIEELAGLWNEVDGRSSSPRRIPRCSARAPTSRRSRRWTRRRPGHCWTGRTTCCARGSGRGR